MIYFLQHTHSEGPGLLADVLQSMGATYEVVHLYRGQALPVVQSVSALVILGGPMNVDEFGQYPFLEMEINFIRMLIDQRVPILGICLGAQLIAKALGERVFQNSCREVGWYPVELTHEAKKDVLFSSLPSEISVFQWHGDTFNLPKGAVRLATSFRCQEQAFRFADNIYAFQFHFEVTPEMVREWVTSEDGEAYVLSAGENPSQILKATDDTYKNLAPFSQKLFQTYFKRITS